MPLKTLVSAAAARLEKEKNTSLAGLAGASSSLFLAALQEQCSNLLIIVPSTEKADILKTELSLFTKENIQIFPPPDVLPGEGIAPSKELIGQRLAVLQNLKIKEKNIVLAPVKALQWKTFAQEKKIVLHIGQMLNRSALIEKLIEFNYRRFEIVGERGEFAVRGGVMDIFPLSDDYPLRLEFSGDTLESLRRFDPYGQRSFEKIDQASILPAQEKFEQAVLDCIPPETLLVIDELVEVRQAARQQSAEQKLFPGSQPLLDFTTLEKQTQKFKCVTLSAFTAPGENPLTMPAASYLQQWETIPPHSLIISRHALRLREELARPVIEGGLRGGFNFAGQEIISDKELFGEQITRRRSRNMAKEGVAEELLANLKKGDYVVHEDYGIAKYCGMQTFAIDAIEQEYLVLEFSGEDKVFIPPAMIGLVSKYSAGSAAHPRLSKLGTRQWAITKSRVKKRLQDMTRELLELYATRQKVPGFAFPPDDIWQKELEETFPYEETPDQKKAILATKQEMELPRPMDRLICGDVGYGKTEVAIRAAGKAVAAGKQVGILVPTTILAEQHYSNFKQRFAGSPFNIEMLSRFRSAREQKAVIEKLNAGGVDIVIGTHRLLQKDIIFRDLGLLIVDEEQRFGVAHKERLKKFRKNVDVLTLTATPIPRTLYMALSGARSVSMINTAPLDRSPVRTYVLEYSDKMVREAILRELDRGGQIYFLHNFVESIEGMAVKIKKLVPEARVAIGHGQLPEKELEKTMLDFMERKFDVLVCTSIIESGLDITNVNTILIDQADRFGLSQLYQIRGRVGRSPLRAYAYLFYHPQKILTETALERLKAIQEFTALGSGYKLAMRDLEIRGAGNLLGAEQSGHIIEVGFDLYCELLEQAVKEIKGIDAIPPQQVEIDLKIEAFIPESFITDERQRMAVYRRMNFLATKEAVEDLRRELRDRFGKIPATVERLLAILHLKVRAMQAGIRYIKEEGGVLEVQWSAGKGKKFILEKSAKDHLKDIVRTLGI